MDIFNETKRPAKNEIILLRKGGENWLFVRNPDFWHHHDYIHTSKSIRYRIGSSSRVHRILEPCIDKLVHHADFPHWEGITVKSIKAIGMRTHNGIWLWDKK